MNHRRSRLRAFFLAIATLLAVCATNAPALTVFAQEVMSRSGTVGIQNDAERKLFWSLLCTCGCPRETLGTCTCGSAHDRRAELRTQLNAGRSIEQIQDDYVARFGSAALAVPPNKGSQRAVWLVPLLAIFAGAGIVGYVLRRWVRRDDKGAEPVKPAETSPDAEKDLYDRRLDEELKALDKE